MVSFTAVLQRSDNEGSTTFVAIPPDAMATFAPKRRVPVIVTIGAQSYRSTIAVYGDDCLIPVRAEIRTALGVAPGDTVEVALVADTTQREVTIPDDLAAALADAGLRTAFDAFSYSHKNEFVTWIAGAKKDATRRNRIAGTIERVRAKAPLKP